MILDILQVGYDVVLPVFCIITLGAVVKRFHDLDIRTLVAILIYVLVPTYIFIRVLESSLTMVEVAQTGFVVMAPMVLTAVAIWLVCRWWRMSPSTTATVIVASIFFNAGNLGIPVAELAFGEEGGAIQAVMMIFVGMPTFVFGYLILSRGQGKGWLDSVMALMRLPYIYAIILALVLRNLEWNLPQPAMECLDRVKDGMIPLALLTLGAQLATNVRWPNWRMVAPVIAIKLIGMPLLAALLVLTLGLWPWPGAQMILGVAAPTAVNTLLLTLEVDGNADDAADCIFWTTAFSMVTLPIVLAILRIAGASGLPSP